MDIVIEDNISINDILPKISKSISDTLETYKNYDANKENLLICYNYLSVIILEDTLTY